MNSVVKGERVGRRGRREWGRERMLKKMGVNIGTGMPIASTEGTKASISSGGEGKPCPSGLLHSGTGLGSGQVVPS